MSRTIKDTVKTLKKISREQHKLPKGKIVSPNKKQYKRQPKKKEINSELHLGNLPIVWPEWWMD